jgi:hypothetical protein
MEIPLLFAVEWPLIIGVIVTFLERKRERGRNGEKVCV